MHGYNLLLTTLLIFYASIVRAEPSTALNLTGPEAVAWALEKNQSMQAARSTIEAAHAYSEYAGRLENPELNLEYASDWAFNNEGERAYSIGIEQRFPVTHRLKLLKNVSALEIQLAEKEFRNQQRLFIRDIELAVDELSSLEARLQLLNEVIDLQNTLTKFLERKIEEGEASTLDLNQVQVARFAVKQDIQNLIKQRDIVVAQLRILLGVAKDVDLQISSVSPELTVLPPMQDFDSTQLITHPEYQYKTLLAEIAQDRTSLAKAERWADIAVEVFFEEERAVDEPVGRETDRFFGIGVSIPLPLNDNNRGEIEASRLRERKIYHETAALKLRLENEANSLKLNAEATYKQLYDYKKSAVELVEKNLEEINRAYAAGQVDLGEVFRVQEQRLEIKTAQVALRHELNQILIRWRAATAANFPNKKTEEISNETK